MEGFLTFEEPLRIISGKLARPKEMFGLSRSGLEPNCRGYKH